MPASVVSDDLSDEVPNVHPLNAATPGLIYFRILLFSTPTTLRFMVIISKNNKVRRLLLTFSLSASVLDITKLKTNSFYTIAVSNHSTNPCASSDQSL
jgi:hypothetical protein